MLWSPVFGFRGRRIGLQEEEIDCKLVCSNVRNLEDEIDCELAGWKGEKNTSESRNFPSESRGAASGRLKGRSVFLETQASAILGHYLPLPHTLPASRLAIETTWYSMLVAPSELSTLQWLG